MMITTEVLRQAVIIDFEADLSRLIYLALQKTYILPSVQKYPFQGSSDYGSCIPVRTSISFHLQGMIW